MDLDQCFASLSLSDPIETLYRQWYASNEHHATRMQNTISSMVADVNCPPEDIKIYACLQDADTRDKRWKVDRSQREVFWGPGERVLCDDVQLMELAREGNLFKFIRNSWVPSSDAGTLFIYLA